MQATITGSNDRSSVACFLHQLAYLHCALIHKAELTCTQSVGRLVAALRSQRADEVQDDDDEVTATARMLDQALTVSEAIPSDSRVVWLTQYCLVTVQALLSVR